MSLGQHLVELRNRLFKAALGVLAGAIVGWILYDFVWGYLATPIGVIESSRPTEASINYAGIATAFDIRFQVSLVTGLVLSSPIWLYQIFAFIVPALERRERRYTFGFFFSAVPLFIAGCVAGFWVMPHVVEVMNSFVPTGGTSFYDAKYFIDFVLKLVLATGIAFALPVFLVLFNFIGFLSAAAIIKGWRWAILAITLFTAAATPAADVVSMFLLAIPMIALYFAAYGVAWFHDRVALRRADRFDAELAAEA
jgi:sec-independent protein translocase protein TatC